MNDKYEATRRPRAAVRRNSTKTQSNVNYGLTCGVGGEKHPHEILKNNLITQTDRGSIYEKITYHSRQWEDITPYIIRNSISAAVPRRGSFTLQ
jgi:hypothetical protein